MRLDRTIRLRDVVIGGLGLCALVLGWLIILWRAVRCS